VRDIGLLFDMDGVVCRNMPAHEEAWRIFFRGHGIELKPKDFRENTMGMPTREVLSYYFKRKVPPEEAQAHADEKETLYRRIYRPKRRAAPGLRGFLAEAGRMAIPRGLGTGSKDDNVTFILDGLKLRDSFEAVVDGGDVKKGKPNPETFLILAERLKVLPRNCVVFEDSLLGEEAARRAGMTAVAVTTSHHASEFRHAKLAVRDFRALRVSDVSDLIGLAA